MSQAAEICFLMVAEVYNLSQRSWQALQDHLLGALSPRGEVGAPNHPDTLFDTPAQHARTDTTSCLCGSQQRAQRHVGHVRPGTGLSDQGLVVTGQGRPTSFCLR